MPTDRPSGRQLVALKNQIVSGFNESHWRELGALTETFDMVTPPAAAPQPELGRP